ncbi:MAG: universal stress protein [Candidatus Thermoplasmatota archaeon]|jgi:nucleotide-binding universal stress UspA family protein|nr:universal stress protein [Candidatus Thermoplasmatota archaeon]
MKAVVAFDGSDPAVEALSFALKLVDSLSNLTILYITPSVLGTAATFDSYVPSSVYLKQDETAAGILEKAKSLLAETKVKYEVVNIDSGGDQVAKSIVRGAIERNCDLIITGTRRLSGLSKMILGSVSSEVVKISTIPVLICPPKGKTEDN